MRFVKIIDVPLARRRKARILMLNRPKSRNCLNVALMHELTNEILRARRSIIALGGVGELFSSGLDLDELLRKLEKYESPAPMLEPLIILLRTLASHPFPTVSLVTGKTRAGGVGLACSADVVVMNEAATYYVPGKLPKERVYRPLARILIPILRRRRDASTTTALAWLGKEFKLNKALEFQLANVRSEKTNPEAMLRDALGRLEPLVFQAEQKDGLAPRLGPDCFAEMDEAYTKVLEPRYVRELRNHLRKRRGRCSL